MQNDHVPVGSVGIWTFNLELVPSAQAQEHVAELEELGYPAVWIPEALGREAMSHAALLLAGSKSIVVCTGIASIWARDAMAMNAAHNTLTEAHPNRFLLGIGVSHQPMVDAVRGQRYSRPLSTMREYLDRMDSAVFMAAPPSHAPQRVLAALGPKMLALAAERSAGAHPYFVPVEHTPFAREALGQGPLLAVEQAVVLETDPHRAREIARKHTGVYTSLPNYTNNLRRFGFGDEDFNGAGSDRLIDAIVAWGGPDAVIDRVRSHLDAGADHVCVQVIGDHSTEVPVREWRELAPALTTM